MAARSPLSSALHRLLVLAVVLPCIPPFHLPRHPLPCAKRVRLLLALLGLPYETVEATGGRGQLTAPGLLAVNPLGEVPVLVDGDLVLRDSHAIMVYLAARHGPAYLPGAL